DPGGPAAAYAKPDFARWAARASGRAGQGTGGRRSAHSCEPHTRIEPRVEHVDHKVDQHEGDCNDEHRRLNDGEIAPIDRQHNFEPDTWPGEDLLGDDGATEQCPEV